MEICLLNKKTATRNWIWGLLVFLIQVNPVRSHPRLFRDFTSCLQVTDLSRRIKEPTPIIFDISVYQEILPTYLRCLIIYVCIVPLTCKWKRILSSSLEMIRALFVVTYCGCLCLPLRMIFNQKTIYIIYNILTLV